MKNLIFIRKLLYSLKKNYPGKIGVYKITGSTTNTETGAKTVTKVKFNIRKAIVLPVNLSTKFAYDLAFVAANKNFTYGGFFDVGQRVFIIDKRDLRNTELDNPDLTYIVFEHRKYQIKSIDKMDFNLGYLIVAKNLTGQEVNEIHDPISKNKLNVTQTVGYVLN